MSIRSIKEIYQLLEEQLRKSTKPMTCVDLMDIPDTRNEALAEYGKDIRIATNKLSDALGLTWRRNLLVRYPAPRETNTLARYAYSWDFKQDAQESVPIPSPVVSRKTSINWLAASSTSRANGRIGNAAKRTPCSTRCGSLRLRRWSSTGWASLRCGQFNWRSEMKFKSKSNKIFNPITLEIVIETKEELAHMWALFNCSNAVILESGAHGREKSESWRRLSMGRRRISHLSCSERSTCTPKPTISFNRHNFTECLVCQTMKPSRFSTLFPTKNSTSTSTQRPSMRCVTSIAPSSDRS